MSKAKIMGVRPYDFRNASGEQVKGLSVFVMEAQEGCYGMEPNKVSLMNERADAVNKLCAGDYNKLINREVEIMYNKKGRAEDFRIANG